MIGVLAQRLGDRPWRLIRSWACALICFGLGVASPASVQASWVTLHLDAYEDSVRLVWITERWPHGVVGFDLMRAPATAGGVPTSGWEPLNRGLLRPTVDPDRSWEDVHPDPEQQLRLRTMLVADLASGMIDVRDDGSLMSRLRGLSPQEVKGLRASMLVDTDRALVNGFGVVVPRATWTPGMVYGLFVVGSDGQQAATPVAVALDVYVPDGDPRFDVEVSFEEYPPTGIRMRWTMPADLYEEVGLRPFEIQLNTVGDDGEPVTQVLGIALIKREGELVHASFGHAGADLTQSYSYTVVARHLFGRERHRSVHVFTPPTPEERRPIEPPTEVEVRQLPGTDVSVTWSFDEAEEARIVGFEVMRRVGQDGTYEPMAEVLPPTARSIVDTGPKTFDDVLAFRVVALTKKGKRRRSRTASILYLDARVPPAPRNLTGRMEVRDGERVVALRWDRPRPEDPVTDHWTLASDQAEVGVVTRQAWVPELLEPFYNYPIQTGAARPYTFEVCAMSKHGAQSEPARVVVETVAATLPPVVIDRFELLDAGRRLAVHWVYEVPELSAFELTVDGEVQALPREARQWKTPKDLDPGSEHTFALQAVGVDGRRSLAGPPRTYRMPAGQGLPITPMGLRVTRAQRGGQPHLRIAWKPRPDGLTHRYVVQVGRDGEPAQDLEPVGVDARLVVFHPVDAAVGGTYGVAVLGETLRGLRGAPARAEHRVEPAAAPPPERPAAETSAPPPSDGEQGWPWTIPAAALVLAIFLGWLWMRRRA